MKVAYLLVIDTNDASITKERLDEGECLQGMGLGLGTFFYAFTHPNEQDYFGLCEMLNTVGELIADEIIQGGLIK